MYPMPTNLADLKLAPVALLVERRLEELAELTPAELRVRVAYDSDREGATAEQRARDVVTAVTRLLDMGGWQASWDARGVRLTHGQHSVVLGAPDTVHAYVTGAG